MGILALPSLVWRGQDKIQRGGATELDIKNDLEFTSQRRGRGWGRTIKTSIPGSGSGIWKCHKDEKAQTMSREQVVAHSSESRVGIQKQ